MSNDQLSGTWSSTELPKSWIWVPFDQFWLDFTDSKKKIAQKNYLLNGRFAVVDQGEALIGGFTDDEALLSAAPLPAIVFGDHTRAVKFIDVPFVQGADGVRVLGSPDGINPAYAFKALCAVKLPDKGYSRHFKLLKATKFPLAPSTEQARITSKIASLNAKLDFARKEIELVDNLVARYKKAVLRKAFTGELTQHWEGRDETGTVAREELSHLHENKVINRRSDQILRPLVEEDLPAGWCLVRLEDICSQIVDGTHHTPHYVEHGVPFVSVKDIKNGSINITSSRRISEDEHKILSRRCQPIEGDLLVTKSGTIGRCAIVPNGIKFSLFVSVALLRPAGAQLSSSFLKYAVEYWVSCINISSEITGTAIKNLHLQDIKALGLPYTSSQEQAEVVRCIEAAFAKIDCLAEYAKRALDLIGKLDEAILATAFRGALVPQDENDEPASVLLERIRAERATAPKAKRGWKRQ